MMDTLPMDRDSILKRMAEAIDQTQTLANPLTLRSDNLAAAALTASGLIERIAELETAISDFCKKVDMPRGEADGRAVAWKSDVLKLKKAASLE